MRLKERLLCWSALLLLAGVAGCGDDKPVDPCEPGDPFSIMACVAPARYTTDLRFIEGEREPGNVHHQAVQDLCAERLEELGFEVERQDYGTGVNVIGVLTGSNPDRGQVMISAHYDGIEDCPSADDNASGVAGALEAARVLSLSRWPQTLVVACWDEEEVGLLGSTAYADRFAEGDERISANIVFEMIGYKSTEADSQIVTDGFRTLFPEQAATIEANERRGDYILLVYDEFESSKTVSDFESMAEQVGLKVISVGFDDDLKRSEAAENARRSDHGPFWLIDEPGIMVTDTAEFRNTHYHCFEGDDVTDRLDDDFAVQIIRASVATAALALNQQ